MNINKAGKIATAALVGYLATPTGQAGLAEGGKYLEKLNNPDTTQVIADTVNEARNPILIILANNNNAPIPEPDTTPDERSKGGDKPLEPWQYPDIASIVADFLNVRTVEANPIAVGEAGYTLGLLAAAAAILPATSAINRVLNQQNFSYTSVEDQILLNKQLQNSMNQDIGQLSDLRGAMDETSQTLTSLSSAECQNNPNEAKRFKRQFKKNLQNLINNLFIDSSEKKILQRVMDDINTQSCTPVSNDAIAAIQAVLNTIKNKARNSIDKLEELVLQNPQMETHVRALVEGLKSLL